MPFARKITHWKPADLPAKPKKEMTQREIDEEAFRLWLPAQTVSNAGRGDAWHAALAYRDAQNREDLAKLGLFCSAYDTTEHKAAVESLRSRAGMEGGQ